MDTSSIQDASDVIALLRELEDVKASLAEEHRTAEHLRTLNEMKNGFLRALSHDLRSPIAVILAFVELLDERTDALTKEQRQIALTCLASSASVIEQKLCLLRDLDELSSEGVQLARDRFDLAAVARDVASHFDTEGRTMIVDAKSVTIDGDQAKVRRIIQCLVSNAVRHTPETTTIAVRVISTDGDAVIEVEDDGPGIDSSLKPRIFEAFSNRDEHAPGIGLAVVSGFVSLHGGHVRVDDVPGGGARFRVTLPRAFS